MAEASKASKKGENREIQEGKVFAIIAYLTILCLIPLLLKKDNKFALYHAKQGLVLYIADVAIVIINIIPVLGQFIFVLGWLACGILSLTGIIQALTGLYGRIVLVSDLAKKISI